MEEKNMKIAIVYVSVTGNTEKMAGYIADGIKSVGDFEVKMINLKKDNEIDRDFISASSAVIFGTPTYCANMCWQLKKWFDEDRKCKLAGKLGAAFATANCLHGGADLALTAIIDHILVKGMLAYSTGTGSGQPYIHLGPVALRDSLEEKKDLFTLFGKRIAEKTAELFGPKA